MRGTPRLTNKAISAPVLLFGAERSLMILALYFWVWAILGTFPHFGMLIAITGLIVNVYFLKFLAKRDPQSAAVFRANSTFLVQNRLYVAKGHAGNLKKVRVKKIITVPVGRFSKL